MMRIDGLSPSSYPLQRPARPDAAVTPYRESQSAAEQQHEQPSVGPSESYERAPQQRRIEAGNSTQALISPYIPVYYSEASPQRPLSSHAAQALASYTNTASLSSDIDANEVLGLDLYA